MLLCIKPSLSLKPRQQASACREGIGSTDKWASLRVCLEDVGGGVPHGAPLAVAFLSHWFGGTFPTLARWFATPDRCFTCRPAAMERAADGRGFFAIRNREIEMLKYLTHRQLLISTAFVLPFTMSASAQTIEINPEQLEGKSAECRELGQLIMDRQEPVDTVSAEAVVAALNEDRAQECSTLQEQIADAGNADMRAEDSEEVRAEDSEKLSEEVDVSETVTVEGEAEVTVPEPNVDVQVPAPNVRVTKQQPQVDITQEGLEVELEQQQPNVSVEIPEIIVRVDIPAPRVYVLRSEPQVQVSDPDPQIEVTQGEPQITVTQGDPQLNVDIDLDEQADGAEGTQQNAMADDGTQRVEGDTQLVQSEPQVEIVGTDNQPSYSYESGEPRISYQRVEPKVSVMMSEKPSIEIQQSGEAEIILETAEEREQRRQQMQQQGQEQPQQDASATGQLAPDEGTEAEQPADQAADQAASDMNSTEEPAEEMASDTASSDQPQATSAQTMTVDQLMDMTVVTAGGEDLGEPEGFIKINGETHLVVGSGGFLGIGEKEVPVPMTNVNLRGDQLVITTLTEDQIEAADDFDYDDDLELPDEEQIEVNMN
ncbi:PRC-barrel domain-containing protein [Pseudohoeflea coraliihabitans]|uniref:PRC-barrel domain-containing protein n=1 Tax=Pseudohoeflea coraliihabitans TaxID=2860393 RepID=A0ABS6WL55_9HYPH|nr:PRC-barrel domain-containing protein [Pseudohoeflea sp. DP4N28-3]MBW3096676.1 PRC-barrel domain-containing protein [Pseudohoeflea sp. DP4N28-3]